MHGHQGDIMNEIITELLKNIPDYKQFLTLEELDESTKKLAREHPDCVDRGRAQHTGA